MQLLEAEHMKEHMKPMNILLPGERQEVMNYIDVLEYLGARVTLVQSLEELHRALPRERFQTLSQTAAGNGFEPEEDGIDGLLIPGGLDIDPARYGQENIACGKIDPVMDELQFTAAKEMLRREKPILGICNGMQMINILFGGDLIQDIESKDSHRRKEGKDSYHPVRFLEGSAESALYGSMIAVNSAHHQAAGRIGAGLKVTARAMDGTVEGLAHESLPIFGLQWHPERLVPWKDYPLYPLDCPLDSSPESGQRTVPAADGRKIYRFFLEVCRKYSQK